MMFYEKRQSFNIYRRSLQYQPFVFDSSLYVFNRRTDFRTEHFALPDFLNNKTSPAFFTLIERNEMLGKSKKSYSCYNVRDNTN